jgi:membrane protease subunit (stomatin/prohibitin family)
MPDLADVLEFEDAAGDVLAVKVTGPHAGGIRWGSQLIVREGQVALFFRDGKAMAVFEPGRHVLTTQNAPLLSKLAGLPYGGETPFRADVVFVGTHLFGDLRWGTPEPVYVPDPVLMQIPIRANGRFAIRVAEPSLFVPKVVGTRPVFRVRDIEDFLRGQYLVPALTDATASLAKPLTELPRFFRELGLGVKALLSPELATLGLELAELSVLSVSTTEEVQQTLNENARLASEGFARAKGTQYDLQARAAGAAALREAGTSYREVGLTDAVRSMAERPTATTAAAAAGGSDPVRQGVELGLLMSMPQVVGGLVRGEPAHSAGGGPKPAPPDPIQRIKQLKELLDLGAITKEEFEAKKAELLGQI